MEGPLRLSVSEPLGAPGRSRVTLTFITVGEYGCSNYGIALDQRRTGDTVALTVLRLVPEPMCDDALGPAHGLVTLPLRAGRYTLLLRRKAVEDRVELLVTDTTLALRPIGRLAFIAPDTSVFQRPAARSFFVSCGTPNVPELCADLAGWLARQRGIVRLPLAANRRIAFSRMGGARQSDYQLYGYSSSGALRAVRRCMRQLADTLKESVGAGVTLEMADGEVLHASSWRGFHEPHIEVPRRISGSRGCPDA